MSARQSGQDTSLATIRQPTVDPALVDLLVARQSVPHVGPVYRSIAKPPKDSNAYLDQQHARAIHKEYGISRLASEVLAHRGVKPGNDLALFLNARSQTLPSASAIRGVTAGARIVASDIRAGRLVAFVGDYDVDGVTALAQSVRVMRSLNAQHVAFSPCRLTQGYGLSEAAVQRAHEAGASTIVCLDIGSSNHTALQLAKSLGIKTVVIDHHLGLDLDTLPCDVLINPHQTGCSYEKGRLCASALTHIWLQALVSYFGQNQLDDLLPLAGFATIADVVPLVGMNRTLTARALELTPISSFAGIRALLDEMKSKGVDIQSQDVAFKIAPILNAAGRMLEHGAEIALKLLTTENSGEAAELAQICMRANSDRKHIESEMLREVATRVEQYSQLPNIIVLESENFHPGVLGLTAARTVERYGRPAILFHRKSDGTLVGSGRSLPGFHLKSLMDDCASSFVRYGGHEAAVGCTLSDEKYEDFKWRVNFYAEDRGKLPAHEAKYDRELSLRAYARMHESIISDLRVLGPTGKDNEPAAFLARNITVLRAYQIGNRHMMLSLAEGARSPLVTGMMWHNNDHPAVIDKSGEQSFTRRFPLRLPLQKRVKIDIVYRPMRLEGRDIVSGETSAKIEIVAISLSDRK